MCPRDSGMLCLHSHWFRRTLFLPSFHCLSSQHSRASCWVSMKLCGSGLVSEFWVLTWLHCDLRDCLLWFLFFGICWGVICFQLCGQFYRSCDVVLRKVYTLWIWGEECCRCLLGQLGPESEFESWISLLIFCLIDLSNIDSGVLKSPNIIVWESKSLCKSLRTCLMYLGAPVLGPCMFRIVSSFCCIDPFTIM